MGWELLAIAAVVRSDRESMRLLFPLGRELRRTIKAVGTKNDSPALLLFLFLFLAVYNNCSSFPVQLTRACMATAQYSPQLSCRGLLHAVQGKRSSSEDG